MSPPAKPGMAAPQARDESVTPHLRLVVPGAYLVVGSGIAAAAGVTNGLLSVTPCLVNLAVSLLVQNVVPLAWAPYLAAAHALPIYASTFITDDGGRAFCANAAVWATARTLLLADYGPHLSTVQRWGLLSTMSDVHYATPRKRSLWRTVLGGVVHVWGSVAGVAAGAYMGTVAYSRYGTFGATLFYGLAAYAALLTIDGVYIVAMAFAGADSARAMHAPLRSTSLKEFWGVRWNATVHRATRAVYRKARKAGLAPSLSVMATFFASGVFHGVGMFFTGAPLDAACMIVAFFVAQGALCILESAVVHPHVANDTARRAFMFAALLGTAPLFTHGVAQTFA